MSFSGLCKPVCMCIYITQACTHAHVLLCMYTHIYNQPNKTKNQKELKLTFPNLLQDRDLNLISLPSAKPT